MHTSSVFLAGLGLFFCGVHYISRHLVPLAGRQIRNLFRKLGRQPVFAALLGSLAGLITQSTTAVTSVTIGLVSSGLVDKRTAILIPTWSNVGTSALVILVAIDLRLAASYLLLVAGITVYFNLDRSERIRNAIGTLFGFGLLFIGMQLLKDGTIPLRDELISGGTVAAFAKIPGLLLGLGAGLAVICQSSSVASALAVAATSAGLVDLSGACWLVYGANLGSSINYYIYSRSYQGDAAQIALMQVVQKLSGFIVPLAIIAAEVATGHDFGVEVARRLAGTTQGQVAFIFLIYQIVGCTFCALFVSQLLPFLEKAAPPTPLQELSKPAFLVEDALVEPSLAIELVGREERRVLERLPKMLDAVRADGDPTSPKPATIRSAGLAVTAAITNYLGAITRLDLDGIEREQAVRLQHRSANLAAMHDGLYEFFEVCAIARKWPSSGRVADQMIEALHTLLESLAAASETDDDTDREMLLTLLSHRDDVMEDIRRRVLREDPQMPAEPQEALFAATMLFERLIWLARRNSLLLVPQRTQDAQVLAAAQ